MQRCMTMFFLARRYLAWSMSVRTRRAMHERLLDNLCDAEIADVGAA